MGQHETDSLEDHRPRHFKRASSPRRRSMASNSGMNGSSGGHTASGSDRKGRDQAIEDLNRHTCNVLKEHGKKPQYRKVNR